MYFSDNWSYLVELLDTPCLSLGMAPVDLSEEDDRGDIEPYVDVQSGELHCTLGVSGDGDGARTCEIARVYEYRENEPFNNKFAVFKRVELAEFVRRLLDANQEFDGFTEDDVQRLKEHYGV